MYAPDFDYYRAHSVAEVGTLLKQHPGAKLLAGGHSLIPLLKLRLAAPGAVIDIGRIDELRGITVDGQTLRIRALTTHAEIMRSPEVQRHAVALAEAAGQIGDPAVRNRGTIGGNVAHADPASDLPTVLTALGASFVVTGPDGERTLAAADFFQGVMTTALGDDELLTRIEVPIPLEGGTAYAKFSHPASRYAVVGVAATVSVSEGTCRHATIAVGGLVEAPVRATTVEQALVGQALTDETIAAAAAQVAVDLGDDLLGDIFASAEYRKAVTPVWIRRAVSAAAARA